MNARDRLPSGRPGVREQPLATESLVRAVDAPESACAAEVRRLTELGDWNGARERFGRLVVKYQHRASRIAFSYLRDAAEADEAVQDAFVKAFTRIGSYRAELPFDAWFTRILINGCLDRRRSMTRRDRWLTPLREAVAGVGSDHSEVRSTGPSPEQSCLAGETRRRLARAIDRLPDRQRVVFLLSQVGGHSAVEVARIVGLNESTVRVHLFRAIRKLRHSLGGTS